MDTVNLNTGKFVISKCEDEEIKSFLESGVSNYFMELSQYINDNDDDGIIHYATEMTMASLFVSGNLRNDPKMTGVQEYGTICLKNNKEVKGRPDIFIKSGTNVIWIECKYQKNINPLRSDHWDIKGWLEWDRQNAFSQVETYYQSEGKNLNNTYTKRYLVTLCFKLIEENKEEHEKQVAIIESKVENDFESNCIWCYKVVFFNVEKGKAVDVEVYGTCYDVLKNSQPITS